MSTVIIDSVLSKGEKGDTGPQGIPGVKGDIGDQGPKGDNALVLVGINDISFTDTTIATTNTLTIPNNYLLVGSKFEFRLTGTISKTSLLFSGDLVINLKLNNTTISALTVDYGLESFTRGFSVYGTLTVKSIGSNGTVFVELESNTSTLSAVISDNTSNTTINTTNSNTLSLSVNGSTNIINGTVRSYHIKEIGVLL